MVGWLDFSMRILAAVVIGTVIGVERERKSRPAGMRTHVLVCLGACIIALIETDMMMEVIAHGGAGVSFTRGRIIAQVVSGIGFLGAGTIITARKKITGLTTAASLWATACLGIAAGLGNYRVAALGCAIVIGVLLALHRIVRVNTMKKMEVRFVHRVETIDFINAYFDEKGIKVLDIDFQVEQREPHNLYTNVYELHLPNGVEYTDIVNHLSEFPNIHGIRTMNI